MTVGGDGTLAKRLGAGGLAVAVFNTVVGAGIFVVPASLARDIGSAAPLAYLACVLAMGAIATCFAAAGSRVPTSGGPYGYAGAAFGPLIGFVTGVLVWLGAVLAAAGIAAALVDGLAGFVPALAQPVGRIGAIVTLFAVLAAANVAGVTRGTGLVAVLTVAKLAPLLLVLAVALPHVHPANLVISAPAPKAFGRAMILALFAFQGMETALGISGEVKDPARNVPRGLFVAMSAVAVLYIGLQVSAQGVLGPALGRAHAPLAQTVGAVAPSLAVVVLAGASVSMLGYLASDALSAPRLLFAFARDGLLPRRIAALHPKSRAPAAAIVLHAALAAVLAISGGFTELAVLSSLTTVVVYAIGCAAAVRLQRRDVALAGPPLVVRGLIVAAALGVLSMVWIAINAAPAEALGCVAAVLIAAGWYMLARRVGRATPLPRTSA